MTELEPNPEQQRLIESREGIYLVDAGAGTGKTFAVTRRYAEIIDQDGVEPDDVLLMTFTNNAADEMRERVVNHCDYGAAKLRDAPISTFHAFSDRILRSRGFDAPTVLGIDDRITSSTEVLENPVVESDEFRRFYSRFTDEHPEYADYYRAVSQPDELLGLIRSLASKGVCPTRDGWFRNSEEYLDGDFDAFLRRFDDANEQVGNRQSRLLGKVGRKLRNGLYPEGTPTKNAVQDDETKRVAPEYADEAFHDDRDGLKRFVHDIYFGYLEHALSRNYLSFGFLQLLAYAVLCEDHALRDEFSHKYVMVDEFQDTSEIQFKLALLLARTDNICVVGDWKQSIFSFRYAAVENIVKFEDRLVKYRNELNDDYRRVGYSIDGVEKIRLDKNYRSTQEILNLSEEALTLEGARWESVSRGDLRSGVTSLKSMSDADSTQAEAFTSDDEIGAVLTKIQNVVGNPDYTLEIDGETRTPRYDDIAVLTRTRDFGRRLFHEARQHGIPVAYEGPVELFRTNPAVILLAWLRLLHDTDSERGWTVILEDIGYTLDEVNHIIETNDYPENLTSFADELDTARESGGVAAVARNVFDRYGMNDGFCDGIIDVLDSTFDSTYMSLGEVVGFMRTCAREGTKFDVENLADDNVVTVQTIHAAKGLEYPVVFVSNINRRKFPPTGGGSANIVYEDTVGLRQKKEYLEDGTPAYLYRSWKSDLVTNCTGEGYDEERRMMYVAMTRAERYLLFSAESGKTSRFFDGLPLEAEEVEPDIVEAEAETTEAERFGIDEVPVRAHTKISAHAIMSDGRRGTADNQTRAEGRGAEYGTEVHEFAEGYVEGDDVTPSNDDEANIRSLIDSLSGELTAEETCYLPLEVDGRTFTVEGVVDLVHVTDDAVDIIDYKTDRSRYRQPEYTKQLSVYYHVVNHVYADREVSASLYYSYDDEVVEVEPLSRDELGRAVQKGLR